MRAVKAKKLRQEVYGDKSQRIRAYCMNTQGSIVCITPERQEYKLAKRNAK